MMLFGCALIRYVGPIIIVMLYFAMYILAGEE
jgi:hypothetical protein